MAVGLVLAAVPLGHSADRAAIDQPIYDVVAVGRAPGKILLATPAVPAEKLVWRFREIPVSPSDSGTVRAVTLSPGGTKALVIFSNGTPQIFDLTQRITGINSKDVFPSQHHLSGQMFPYASNGKVCLLNDAGHFEEDRCRAAESAVIHEDGRVLYALHDGRLIVAGSNGDTEEELPYRLPEGLQFQLLAGRRQDVRDFLVLVKQTEAGRDATSSSSSLTQVIDPRLPAKPLGHFIDPVVAALSAQFDFTGPLADSSPARSEARNAYIAALTAHLREQMPRGEVAWSFYRLAANVELYAPILEFASGEPDYPSDVDIWDDIRPLSHGTTRQAYETAYASMGDRRWSRCASYIRTISYPGTWLIEYWFYYPFDQGKPHSHIHDSEHMFVEVDKLGGTVRNVFASDHGSFAPNDIYSTLPADSSPVPLPIYAMVELAKHAMAPDINHAGHFSREVDDNLHKELYSSWGLRDRDTKIHLLMEPYLQSMSLPRDRSGRFALKDAANLFPGLDVPAEHQICTALPFPEDPPCPHCDAATAAVGINHLIDHPDARAPKNIFKPYVLPWREVRVGVGIYDWSQGRGQLSVALVGDLRHMTGGLVPAPARLAVEYIWTPTARYVPVRLGGHEQYLYSKSTMYAGLRVERLVTHTEGFYFGVTPEWADISTTLTNSAISPAPLHWQYGGFSYHIGYLVELPSAHKGNLTNQIGIVIQNSFATRILFEWRISLGLLRQRGRHDFGARATDRNPYE